VEYYKLLGIDLEINTVVVKEHSYID
jgi:hypothetical protein